METWVDKILFIPVLLFSIIIHECAHGVAAYRAGDPTAKMMGRITLNPIPHIDIMGSIIVPLLFLLTPTNILFGWAKPVPVNPANFRNRKRDEMIVSAAGPASNIALSLIFLVLTILTIGLFQALHLSPNFIRRYFNVMASGMLINLVLAFFNLIPIPPLDGSHILENILPPRGRVFMARLQPYGFFILLIIIMVPQLIQIAYWPVKMVWHWYMLIMGMFL
ncbi:MAG: site-2 protease family protein [Calditrichaeota bacterium]|nr:site-2 protease family protein [Calditrichota bacterium]